MYQAPTERGVALNPYTPSSSRLFYGREPILRDLLKDEEASQAVVFVGGRRCGKTRLLQRVRDYLQNVAKGDVAKAWEEAVPDALQPGPARHLPPHWPFLVNFQGLTFSSLEQALSHIAGAMAKGHAPVPLPAPCDGCDTHALESWLQSVDAALDSAGLGGIALLIDEVADLFQEPWHHDLMAFLRRLDDHTLRSRVWIVLTGGHALDGYQHLDGSPPLNTVKRRFLRDLDYGARRRMAIEPFVQKGRLPPSDEVLHAVDRAAAGNVWILTLLLEHLFEKDGPLTVDAVHEAEERILDEQNIVFERWAKALEGDGWDLYRKTVTSGALSSENVRNNRERAARNLLEYHALVHRRSSTGDIEMGPELFRRWAVGEGKIHEPFGPRPKPDPDKGMLPPGHYRYDVALSYATPQGESARKLADLLRQQQLRVFYDKELSHELWGIDLARCLPSIYDREARITVLLISQDYVGRVWPRIEAAAALAKALREEWQAVLLVSLDGTRLPDVPESIVYEDLSQGIKTVENVALQLTARLGTLRA